MNSSFIIHQLGKNQTIFEHLFKSISTEQIQWKPQPEKWTLIEIVCHLHDEEKEDFRTRLSQVLVNPEIPFPKIDPVDWVVSRNYASKDYFQTLNVFLDERKKSVEWLNSLKQPKWDNAFIHSKFGPLSGHFLLSNWLAHDYLHIRQVTKLKYDYLVFISGEKMDYAGKW